jgi:hypothetical protein
MKPAIICVVLLLAVVVASLYFGGSGLSRGKAEDILEARQQSEVCSLPIIVGPVNATDEPNSGQFSKWRYDALSRLGYLDVQAAINCRIDAPSNHRFCLNVQFTRRARDSGFLKDEINGNPEFVIGHPKPKVTGIATPQNSHESAIVFYVNELEPNELGDKLLAVQEYSDLARNETECNGRMGIQTEFVRTNDGWRLKD